MTMMAMARLNSIGIIKQLYDFALVSMQNHFAPPVVKVKLAP